MGDPDAEKLAAALTSAEKKAGQQAKEAWSLMRRTSRVKLTKDKPRVLTEIARIAGASRAASLKQSDSAEKFQELACILPGLDSWIGRVKPQLLEELLSDTAGAASKLVQLQHQLPHVDVCKLIKSRPSLLSQDEFAMVPRGIGKLELVFGEPAAYAKIVQMFPSMLLVDAEELLAKLQQQLGFDIDAHVVLQDPSLLMSVADNRNLSIW
ncbi:hypothetical protein WJX84_004310 [Apatococcus fuscideae]|uniref:Uncharacterized protein n=1 Tax=Apatococcus fuscideae TaxID=2026836 RepID=A0AAW1TAU4_9CHLO